MALERVAAAAIEQRGDRLFDFGEFVGAEQVRQDDVPVALYTRQVRVGQGGVDARPALMVRG